MRLPYFKSFFNQPAYPIPVSYTHLLTTDSLATRPLNKETEALQSAKPHQVNTGAKASPKAAKMLSSGRNVRCSRPSNECKNHITTEAAKIKVPALRKKSFRRCQTCTPILCGVGSRYGGNSITKVAVEPFPMLLWKKAAEAMADVYKRQPVLPSSRSQTIS